MTTDDLKQIRGVIKEELSYVEERLEQKIEGVSERLTFVKKELEQKIEESGKSVMSDIAQFMDDQIAPMIDEKADKTDIERLERKLDLNLSKNLEQDHRLSKLESVPLIAHELKIRKQ